MRRSFVLFLLNVSGESPSFRAKPGMRNLLADAQMSPYKEQFKDYWATPVPFADREFGEKPALGDPVPARRAASTIVVARNRHVSQEAVEAGEDNDYKVLMMFREAKGRYLKDQFIFPSSPVRLEDSSEDWAKVLRRRGLQSHFGDLHQRLTAHRSLLAMANLLVIPKEGGGIAEVEGPPGPRKWHLIVWSQPGAMKSLIDVLELPMESTLSQFIPFRRVVTPITETFRFDNLCYLVPFDKIPEVQYTISTEGERLVWVSPMEAIARFNAGIMNMPTANIIALSELNNECPTYAEVTKKTNRDVPRVVQPELFHHGQTKVATVVLPGDVAHSQTTEEDRAAQFVRRFQYTKDYPYGVRAVFEERKASAEELTLPLVMDKPALLEEANESDLVYAEVPYPQRQRQPEEGRTAYPVPEYSFQEGAMNAEGLIPPSATVTWETPVQKTCTPRNTLMEPKNILLASRPPPVYLLIYESVTARVPPLSLVPIAALVSLDLFTISRRSPLFFRSFTKFLCESIIAFIERCCSLLLVAHTKLILRTDFLTVAPPHSEFLSYARWRHSCRVHSISLPILIRGTRFCYSWGRSAHETLCRIIIQVLCNVVWSSACHLWRPPQADATNDAMFNLCCDLHAGYYQSPNVVCAGTLFTGTLVPYIASHYFKGHRLSPSQRETSIFRIPDAKDNWEYKRFMFSVGELYIYKRRVLYVHSVLPVVVMDSYAPASFALDRKDVRHFDSTLNKTPKQRGVSPLTCSVFWKSSSHLANSEEERLNLHFAFRSSTGSLDKGFLLEAGLSLGLFRSLTPGTLRYVSFAMTEISRMASRSRAA
eukprot:gene7225-5077_t